MKRIEFVLTMPGVGSWNGIWSGKNKHYSIVKKLTDKKCIELEINGTPKNWRYSWNDGWYANIAAVVLLKGVRAKKSAGFCGYDWMVDNIIARNDPKNIVRKEKSSGGENHEQN